jgi:hypothetical protein
MAAFCLPECKVHIPVQVHPQHVSSFSQAEATLQLRSAFGVLLLRVLLLLLLLHVRFDHVTAACRTQKLCPIEQTYTI